MLPSGGCSSADTSECQPEPLLRRESLSVWMRRGMDVQVAEVPTEGEVLCRCHVLVAHEQHEVAHPGIVNFLDDAVLQGLGEVDADHPGTDLGCQRFDVDIAICTGHPPNDDVLSRTLHIGGRAH